MLGHEDQETPRRYYYRWIRLVEAKPLAEQDER